jgi:hypothetical protein
VLSTGGIITTKWQRDFARTMLATATEHYQYFHADPAQPLEVYRSKILAHHAKAGYDYPTIRLPFAFSALIGLSTRIYQTIHDGALAFLVVVSPSRSNLDTRETGSPNVNALRLQTAEVGGSNPAEPIDLRLRLD